jgi:hypothetical protein
MLEGDVADLASALLIAIGLGFAFACAYVVRRPRPLTPGVWIGAMLVAVPGLLVGLVASDSDLGVRAAYRHLTAVLEDPLIIEAEIVLPRPELGTTGSPMAVEIREAPTLAPSAEVPDPGTAGDDPAAADDPTASPAPTTGTETPPPTPSETVPPTPSETPPPTPSETPPPTPSETPPPSPSGVPEPSGGS